MNQPDIIELLSAHEETISKLYTVYSEKFPLYSDFWLTLAREEQKHSAVIISLKSKVDSGTLSADMVRFKSELLKTLINYLNNELAKTEAGNITLIQALSTARDIEKSMIERRCFEVFKGDPAELKTVLEEMTLETKRHIEKIEIAWQENRVSL